MPSTADALKLPFDDAISFFRQKVNQPTARWSDMMKEAHSRAFTVAGATSEALLQDFRDAVDKAISQGTTLAEFRKDFDTIVAKHGWVHNGSPGWRSRVIYETNLSTAYSAGRYAQATDPDVLRVFPYWMYRHGGSRHPRLQHLGWDGLVLRADDPFWASHYPPNGWRCSCYQVSLGEHDLVAMGRKGPDPSPVIEYRDWKNPSTGAVTKVPVGIDPGFDYNPGAAWKQGAAQPVKAPALRPEGAPDLVQLSSLTKPIIEDFMRDPSGRALEIGRLPSELQHALGSDTTSVILSSETMRKQSIRHPKVAADIYLDLARMLMDGYLVVREKPERLRLFARRGQQWFRVVVKRTADRREVYLMSVHDIEEKRLASQIARYPIVVDRRGTERAGGASR